MKLSIIIPVYNEKDYILSVLEKVNKQKDKFDLEIIVTDDGSIDGTADLIKNNKHLYNKAIFNQKNEGKGSAIKECLNHVTGDYVLIQDADLEYNPDEYINLVSPIINYNAEIVFGSRFKGGQPERVLYFKNRVANFILSLLVSILTDINFSDVETGYKLIKTSKLKSLNLNEKSFGIEIEIVMKLAKTNSNFYEVGISYHGRTYEEGKKIRFIDGIIALYKIFYYKFFN
jgi:glycosyltransferase involved in cell wall biosynthesis